MRSLLVVSTHQNGVIDVRSPVGMSGRSIAPEFADLLLRWLTQQLASLQKIPKTGEVGWENF
ncbi:hypothetical protein [Microseira sp. BLCC-F43]|uniref:hypothetical protein n=1 Tax=Microseira sp. BLCC-F43 TaxID=3153602 RepID=UPI0035B82801